MNSLCVPRFAKESIGAICQLQQRDGRHMTINIEYNQLDGLLRQSGYPDGTVLVSFGLLGLCLRLCGMQLGSASPNTVQKNKPSQL